jgi:hypothetical protein
MKKIFLVLTALSTCLAFPSWSEEKTLISVGAETSNAPSNKDIVEWTRASYEEGEYKSFLKAMDQKYQEGVDAHEVEGLISFLKQTGKYSNDPKTSQAFLQEKHQKQLQDLIENEDTSLFVEKVRISATPLPKEAQDAFQTLTMIQMKEPGTGDHADENKVNDLIHECIFKIYHLKATHTGSAQELKQKETVLEMQCFDKLKKASESFSNESLKNKINAASEHVDFYLIQKKDTMDLIAYHAGLKEPKSELEKKVVQVIHDAHQARSQQ